MKIIKSTKNIKGKYHIKNSTCRNISIKAATNKNSSVRLQMKEELMDQILSEIKSKLKEIMTSYQFGYDDNEWEDYSGADIYLDNRGYIVITVYAEVSYNGLVKIMDALNPIVEKYDSDAYFDADTPGRCSAYIDPDNVPSNMYPYDDIQNSEKIYSDDSIMFEGNNYEYVTNNHGYWIYRTVVDGKGVWRAMKQDSDESQFDKLSFPITYEQARGDEPIGEPNSIARLRKDLGKKLLPKSGQSVEATEDLSSYPEEFRNAYQKAKTEFINRYPNLGVSIIRDDPYAEDGEVAVLVKDYDTGDHAKCYLVYSVDELISSDYEWMLQAFEETAEAIGLLEDNTVYSSVESSDYESDSGIFIEDIIDSLEDNGYDLTRIRSIRQGLLELFGYKGKDADIIIHDLVAGRFIDPNDWVDKNYTPGIYSATKEEYKTSENYKGRRIKLLNDGTGYAIFEKGEMIDYGFKSLEDAEAAIDEYDDIYQDDVQVYSDTAEDEEDLPMVDQEYDSAATSINSNKLPAIYKMVSFNEGDVIVDFGGGKFDNAVEYIRDKGATLVVYDPYNRSAEHNKEVLRILRENGGADAAVNSNVLNVIKEPEARKNVLENIARITKPGAPIYITVYEGKGNGQEGPTKSGYQLNRKTADYLEEIQEVFPDATRRGKLITAHNTGSVTSSTDVQSSSTILCSYDEFITWYDNLSDEEQWKVDDIADTNGIPFYEEASDDELSWLHDVATSEIHASADTVEGASNEVELDPEESMIDMNIDQYIIVDSEGSWDYDSDNYDWASSDGEGSDWYSDNGVRLDDPTGVVEKIDELIEPHIPIEPGTYRVQGYIELYYTVSGVYENRYDYTSDDYSSDINSDLGSAEYNKKLSKIEDIKVTKI